jgi:formamidopyrimidine-DNA glycosylase
MPELPEVETVRLQLLSRIVGKTIESVEIFHSKTVAHNPDFAKTLCQKTFSDIQRVGKLLIFSFQNEDDFYLLAHLKMTGQFFYMSDDEEVVGGGHSLDDKSLFDGSWPHKHTRVALYFHDGSVLYFNDMRLFGYLISVNKAERDRRIATFGPEPHQPSFQEEVWIKQVQKRQTNIKAALLDQTLIAGLGNIYVDEALWLAEVAPERRASSLTMLELQRIRKAAAKVLREAIKAGGTTFSTFKDAQGGNGSYVKRLKVFGRQGLVCTRCGETILKIKVAGRGTHWCPSCQK